MRRPQRRRFCSNRGATLQATCWPRQFSVFASQCRAGLARVGNRVSVLISHARLLHLRHFMRVRAMSSATHTKVRMPPLCTRMPFCIMLCLALSCEKSSTGITLSNSCLVLWWCNNKSGDPFTAKTLTNRTTIQQCQVHGDQSSLRQLSRWRACHSVRQCALYRDLSSHNQEVAASHIRSLHGGCIRCGQYHFSLRGKRRVHYQPHRTYNAVFSKRSCVQHQSSDDYCRGLYHGTPNT